MSETPGDEIRLADPTPLGFGALAVGTFLAGTYLAGWVSDWQWLALPFLYGGLVLVLTGMWEFNNRSTFGATAFTLYGGIGLSLGTLGIFSLFGKGFAEGGMLMGWSMLSVAALTLFMVVWSLRTSMVSLLTFLALEVAEILLAIAYFAQTDVLLTIAGYVAMVGGVLAWYACAAGVINRMGERVVLGVGAPLWGGKADIDRPGSPLPRLELPLHPRTH
ncbi:MAG TPA: acetate uptake transporter [Candidatus Dormibacteraeota bacterium]|jgi:succinate-acetate transporter protein|nr:acetate uptake transporter [Candidatus Dormibacteraeota bacterium]